MLYSTRSMVKQKKQLVGLLSTGVLLAAGAFFVQHELAETAPASVASQTKAASEFSQGVIKEGVNTGSAAAPDSPATLKTDSKLTYESPEVTTDQPNANAVGIMWDQQGGEAEGAHTTSEGDQNHAGPAVEMRTFDGKNWTAWTGLGSSDDRKDNTGATHSAILLTEKAAKAQYRFSLAAGESGQSAQVSNIRLTALDGTKGPDPTKPSLAAKVFGQKAVARPAGPRVFSRAEWGCPEPDSSPGFPPEYRPLGRVIVHHTAAAVSPSSSAAAIRSIWQYHTYTNGWGDIGYNYLVDLNGNTFQGRYYNQAYAQSVNQEVVGAHAFGNNYGTIGIATLGNFTDQGVSSAMVNSVGQIAGYKAMTHNFNPGDGANLVGHRDVGQTNCPGNNMYANLSTVRAVASNSYVSYSRLSQFDFSYQGQGVGGTPGGAATLSAGQTAPAYLDLKNEGTHGWQSTGPNPVKLGTNRPRDRASGFYNPGNWLSPSRTVIFNEKVTIAGDGTKTVAPASLIAPGEIARFNFQFRGPDATGTFDEHFQPVVEGYTWFEREVGVFWKLTASGAPAPPPNPAGKTPFYRLYGPGSGDHFYTTSNAERSSAIAGGYIAEGVSSYVYSAASADRTPLYRFFNPRSGKHFYTASTSERTAVLNAGFVDEGIGAYVHATQVSGSTPLYRLFNPRQNKHFYTINTAERDAVVNSGYSYEGPAGYVFADASGSSVAAAGDSACDPADTAYNNGVGSATRCRQLAASELMSGGGFDKLLALGDLQYEDGALAKFQASYDPSWGRFKNVTAPAPGNHEYGTPGAAGYYDYFGAAAGERTTGYYSFDVGNWHLVALNSNCNAVGGCGAGSAQEQWLRADLAASSKLCTLAYWHHPRFSSGAHGSDGATAALWQTLYDAKAEVILGGHDHNYERFAPQTPAGGLDNSRGLREFVVGTGGKNLRPFGTVRANSQSRNSDTFGLLKLTLGGTSYTWQFLPEAGKTFTDTGTGLCK